MKRLFGIFLAAAAVSGGVAVSQVASQSPPAGVDLATPTGPTQGPLPALPSTFQTASRGQVIDNVAATVNDQVISRSDVLNRMRMILLSFSGKPDDEIIKEAQYQALESLIDEKVELQEFEKLVKDEKIKDEEIEQRIDAMAQQNKMTRVQFLQNLNQAGVSTQSLRDQQRAEIAWTALIRGRYARTVRISEQRINEMMNRIKESLDKPQYNLGEIFLYAPDQASRANAKTTAERLIGEINKGADFRAVAQQFSASPSASQGGQMGWMSLGDMRPEIAAAVQTGPAPPTVLAPVESEGGVYVIALLGKREPTEAKAATFNLMQIVARGDDAAAKLQQVKTKATTCAQLADAAKGVEGVTAPVPMNGVALRQVSAAYRPALENLQANQSTDPLDLSDGGKMVFYVCARQEGDSSMPTREQIKDRLFNIEIGMIEERYRRDLKRKASIQRR